MKVLSRFLTSMGLLLLAFWALARVHSGVASAEALEQFSVQAATAPNPAEESKDIGVDTSLWSKQRIEDFKKAIGMASDPALAVVAIPRLGVEAPLFRGTDEMTLNRGLGWIHGTALPGSPGNIGIAAHRDGFFRALKDIAINDVIELRTPAGVETFYVSQCSVVEPSRVDVLAPTSETALTLVTCYPFYFVGPAPQRFIVRAGKDRAATAQATGICPHDADAMKRSD